MKRIPDEVVSFFKKQHYVILTTIGADGVPHGACKGIARMTRGGEVYLVDLYKGTTYGNLAGNAHVSITAVDEHVFRGYCLKGSAEIVGSGSLAPSLIRAWERRLSSRITHRIIKSLRGDRGHPRQPEALMPQPQYLILMRVAEIVNLTPGNIR